ncbi:hypothetical protein [Streptomyces sp. ODS28]|uniref:hypothetical protein n=1 Tax=Streptomyces sp. ODS28 TaxID=3136688 RepID=UPI0031E8B57B
MTAEPEGPPRAGPGDTATATGPRTAADAFDLLYERHARGLARQAVLLCGHRRVAERAVTHAFHRAWQRWPEVAVDRDPAGWARIEVYGYALSPWHQLRPDHRHPEAHPGPPADRALLDALLSLPPSYRATLLLHDGVGLNLPDTAAETESSTPAAAGRLTHAREDLTRRLPWLAEAPEERRSGLLADWLRELAAAQPVRVPPARTVRAGSEGITRRWTRAALGLTGLVLAVTGLTTATWHSAHPPVRHPEAALTTAASDDRPGGRPGGAGRPGPDGTDREAQQRPGRSAPLASPSGGGLLDATGTPYLPELRSTNMRMDEDALDRTGRLKKGWTPDQEETGEALG